MHLREGQFDRAHTDFFEAFKNYDESGSPRRITCLKYLVLANMLIKSDINPFDSQEAKPFKVIFQLSHSFSYSHVARSLAQCMRVFEAQFSRTNKRSSL